MEDHAGGATSRKPLFSLGLSLETSASSIALALAASLQQSGSRIYFCCSVHIDASLLLIPRSRSYEGKPAEPLAIACAHLWHSDPMASNPTDCSSSQHQAAREFKLKSDRYRNRGSASNVMCFVCRQLRRRDNGCCRLSE